MTQTLTAFLALSTVMFFSLTQIRGELDARRDDMSLELEVMANAIATDLLQRISTKPFDSRLAGQDLRTYSAADLTPVGEFGPAEGSGGNLIDLAADIDDLHQIPTHEEHFVTPAGDVVPFLVDVSVHYVDGAGYVSTSPTWSKEVRLTVRDRAENGTLPIMRAPATISRRFAP